MVTVAGNGTPRIVRVAPSSLNGASHPATGHAYGAPLTLETSADPAGLTARARPKARPDPRAANHKLDHAKIKRFCLSFILRQIVGNKMS